MEKSDFLNYRALKLEVRHLRARVAELEVAGKRAPGPDYSAALDLYRIKVAEKIEAFIAIETALEALASPAERLLMRLRYIDGLCWARVCMELQSLGYSERQVYYLHGSALKKLKEV